MDCRLTQQHRDHQGAGHSLPTRSAIAATRSLAVAVLLGVLSGCQPAPPPETASSPIVVTPGPEPAPEPVVEPTPEPVVQPLQGIEVIEREAVTPDGGLAPRITAVVADPGLTRIQVVCADKHPAGWQTSAPIAEGTGALAVINGGYFSAESKPLGLVVSDGQRRNPLTRNSSPIFAIVDGEARILDAADLPDKGVEQAVQCGPRLIRNGTPTKLKESEPSRRSAVGLNQQGQVMLAATTSGLMSLAQFAAELAEMGCRDAINLDGGPSSGFVVPGVVSSDGPQPMPTHLLILAMEDQAGQ